MRHSSWDLALGKFPGADAVEALDPIVVADVLSEAIGADEKIGRVKSADAVVRSSGLRGRRM